MNKRIEELVKFIETGISTALCASCGGVGSTCENDCPAPTTRSLHALAIQILSNPDFPLTLIDRGKLDANLKFLTDLKATSAHLQAVRDCVIPLADALKEAKK